MTEEFFKESALRYHSHPVPGKIAIWPTKPLSNNRDLARAYSPGVAHACELIVSDPAQSASMTARGNLVAVATNGTAVPGLGAIGPLAAKPVGAALYNGLRIFGKQLDSIRLVATGAGAACIACVDLFLSMGLKLRA